MATKEQAHKIVDQMQEAGIDVRGVVKEFGDRAVIDLPADDAEALSEYLALVGPAA